MRTILIFYELMSSTEVIIPLGQIFLFILVVSILMLLKKLKFSLIATYLCVFYWGFVLNKSNFISKFGSVQYGLYLYGACGFIILSFTFYSFFFKDVKD